MEDQKPLLPSYISDLTKPILFGRSLMGWLGFLVGLLIMITTLLSWNTYEKWQIALNFFLIGFVWGCFYFEGWVIKFRVLTDRVLEGWKHTMELLHKSNEDNLNILRELNKSLEKKIKRR